jgi:hypothetical protein
MTNYAYDGKVTKCPPGEAIGARDLQRWATGVRPSKKERDLEKKFTPRRKRDAADRWLARNDPRLRRRS